MRKVIFTLCLVLATAFSCKKETSGCWICDYGNNGVLVDTLCGNSEDEVRSHVALNGVQNPSKEAFEQHCHKK